MINVAVLGYGTVGSGVYEVLVKNKESIAKRAGDEINVKYVLDLRDFPGDPVQEVLVHDFSTIVNDPEVDIVAEAMGGLEPAYTFAKQTLESGKNYCTSNKELVAKYGPELLELAKSKGKNFLFEASVGGGIPIIRPLNQSLTADELTEITGILNGTTNFILSKMAKEGSSFDAVLKEAQNLGYAERNPAADVEGYDACRKIAILSSLAYGCHVDFEDIYTEGITKITDIDFKYAKKLGLSIKLFGKSKKVDDKCYAMVAPFMIDSDNPLYSVNGVLNGILVKGDVIGDVMFYGAGAGKLPTASAVVADIVDEAKHLNKNIMTIWSNKKLALENLATLKNKFFVRFDGPVDSKMSEVTKAFGDVKVVTVDGLDNEFAVITDVMTEAEFEAAAAKVAGVKTRIRVEA
ncbi:MAG: homoserine dehydrogenase [Lachnospiraceae bacterium]|nr:homoserine dehydrogenase [Lachnospiraceae bacterium]